MSSECWFIYVFYPYYFYSDVIENPGTILVMKVKYIDCKEFEYYRKAWGRQISILPLIFWHIPFISFPHHFHLLPLAVSHLYLSAIITNLKEWTDQKLLHLGWREIWKEQEKRKASLSQSQTLIYSPLGPIYSISFSSRSSFYFSTL